MSKLVDKERLAKLAKALDARMKAAVAAEETARKAADEALQIAVKALEDANKEGGAVAEAIAAVQSALDEFEAAQAIKDGEQDAAIQAAQKAADDAQADVDAVEKRLDDEGGLVDRIEANEAFVAAQPAKDQAQDGRLDALEAKFAGDNSVDNKIAAAEAAAKQHAEDKDAVLKQELEGKINAKVAQADYDVKMAALEAEDADIRADFAAADAALQGAMEEVLGELNTEVNASLVELGNAVGDLQDADEAIRGEFAAADNQLKANLQAEIDADVKAEADRAKAAEQANADAIAAEVTRAQAAEKANADEMTKQKDAAQEGTLANKIAANAAAVAAEQERAEEAEADLDAAIKAEATARDNAVKAEAQAREAADNALDGRVAAIEESIGDGGNLEARVAANEDAIAVINGTGEGSIKKAIADLVDGAPEATNTLNELAQAIKDNKDVYDGWVAAHEQAMAQMKTDLQKEIDDDVKVVADELAEQMNEGVNGSLAHKIAAAQTAADKAQGEVDAVEVRMNTAEGNISTLQGTVAQHTTNLNALDNAITTEKGRAEGQEAAIREEFADADADLHDAIKGEMAAVIQSLAVGIVDGKLRVALGGIEGDDVLVIREQEVPFVTDADIEEIIAGLDAE